MAERTRAVGGLVWAYNDGEDNWYAKSKGQSLSVWKTWKHGGKYSLCMDGKEVDHYRTVKEAMETAAALYARE